jgi:hypothetical protein
MTQQSQPHTSRKTTAMCCKQLTCKGGHRETTSSTAQEQEPFHTPFEKAPCQIKEWGNSAAPSFYFWSTTGASCKFTLLTSACARTFRHRSSSLQRQYKFKKYYFSTAAPQQPHFFSGFDPPTHALRRGEVPLLAFDRTPGDSRRVLAT